MNFSIYATIAVVLTLFFAISYISQRKPFQLAFAIWVPSTLLQYISNNRVYFNILSVVEIIFFIVILVLMYKEHKKEKLSAQKVTEEEVTEE